MRRALLAEVEARQGEILALDGLSFDLAATARALAGQLQYSLITALLARPPRPGLAGAVILRFLGPLDRDGTPLGIKRASVVVPGLVELHCPLCARRYPGAALVVERVVSCNQPLSSRIRYTGLCPERHGLPGFCDYLIMS